MENEFQFWYYCAESNIYIFWLNSYLTAPNLFLFGYDQVIIRTFADIENTNLTQIIIMKQFIF